MSPLAIRLILHVHAIAEPIENITSPAVKELMDEFLRDGLIATWDFGSGYQTTERGRIWVDMICATPIPVMAWIDPRGDAA